MDLLDRYLQAVRKHLPFERQDDIVAELRANLESQLEEKEAALGRPLTQLEAEEWIKQLGSPIQVAAGYQTHQYLIGPNIFPIYRYVLKLACSWAAVIYSIVTVVQVFATQNPSASALLEALFRLPFVLINTAAWVTVTFGAIEYAVAHQYLKLPANCAPFPGWTPSALPPLGTDAAQGKKPRSYAQAVAELVFGILFLGWLLLIPHNPWLLMGPGVAFLYASPYQLDAVWWQFYWGIVVLNIVQLGWNSETLLRGKWSQPQPIKQIAFKFMGLIPLAFVLGARDHVLIVLKHPALDQASHGASLAVINLYVYRSFLIIAAIASLQLVWDLVILSRNSYRNRATAM